MKRLISSFIGSLIILLIIIGGITLYAATGTPSTLIVKTDANSYLLVTAVTQTNPVTQGVFSSRRLSTDASGSLQVVLTGTVTPTYPQSIPASTCAAPSLGMAGGATTGIAFTATPSILMCISGTAVETITSSLHTITTATLIGSDPGGAAQLRVGGQATISSSLGIGQTAPSADLVGMTAGTFTSLGEVIDATVTWNNAGVTFTGWKLNVTDTASGVDSSLIDLQVGSTSQFSINKSGFIAGKEQTAPAAPAANGYRIYAVDNGSGKTQLCALFSSGAAQCFATQP